MLWCSGDLYLDGGKGDVASCGFDSEIGEICLFGTEGVGIYFKIFTFCQIHLR